MKKVLNKDIVACRGYLFDRISQGKHDNPETIVALDNIASCGFKSVPLPLTFKKTIKYFVQNVGNKPYLESVGKYLAYKLASLTSAETPKPLPSRLLPSHTPDNEYIYQQALDYAETSRHKKQFLGYSPEGALAHAALFFPSGYGAAFRVFLEMRRRIPDFKPIEILDFGASTGYVQIAAQETWESFKGGLAIESSTHLTQIGKAMTSDLSTKVQWQYGLYEKLKDYDLVVSNYALTPFSSMEARILNIKNLWNRTKPGGVLVIIERGTPTGFRYIHDIRETFIAEMDSKDFHFVAPCPHEGRCPLALNDRDWCHFAQEVERLPTDIFRKGSRTRRTDFTKFSYLVVRKSEGPRSKYKNEHTTKTLEERSFFWPRIVFPVIRAHEHALLDVCAAPHSFLRLGTSRTRSHSQGYRFARKAMWGDLWRYPKRLCRPEARNYISPAVRFKLQRAGRKSQNLPSEEPQIDPDWKNAADRSEVTYCGS